MLTDHHFTLSFTIPRQWLIFKPMTRISFFFLTPEKGRFKNVIVWERNSAPSFIVLYTHCSVSVGVQSTPTGLANIITVFSTSKIIFC